MFIDEMENKKHKWIDIVSNTTEDGVSATGLAGMMIIIVALLVFIACVMFYFFNIAEANNIFTLVNSAVTVLGIGSGILVGRRISSDFGPNNRLVIGEDVDGDGNRYKTMRRNKVYQAPQQGQQNFVEGGDVEENITNG